MPGGLPAAVPVMAAKSKSKPKPKPGKPGQGKNRHNGHRVPRDRGGNYRHRYTAWKRVRAHGAVKKSPWALRAFKVLCPKQDRFLFTKDVLRKASDPSTMEYLHRQGAEMLYYGD